MQTGYDGYEKWLKGDREALSVTVSAYNKRLIYYVGALIGSYAEAEDVVSETFVRLLVKKPRFREEAQLTSWLYKTARNISFDYLRRHKNAADELSEELADRTELEKSLVESEEQQMLHRALDELNRDYRDVLILLYFGELSYEQAGAVMKKNLTQIRNLAFRARASLKEKLERMGFQHENG